MTAQTHGSEPTFVEVRLLNGQVVEMVEMALAEKCVRLGWHAWHTDEKGERFIALKPEFEPEMRGASN